MLATLLESTTVFCVGLMTGAVLYTSIVEVPARAALSPSDQLTNWQSIFPRAAKVLKNFGLFVTVLLILTTLITLNFFWFLAAALLFGLGPFTALKISPTNNKLLAMTKVEDANEVTALIAKWGELHNIRTIITFVGFLFCLIATL